MNALLLLAASFVRLYLRDRLTVVLSLALMVFMMVLFGLVMGEEQFRVALPVAVLDQAKTPASARALAAMRSDDLLEVTPVANEAEMVEQIRRAKVIAGLTFGATGSNRLVTSESASKWQRIGIDRLQQLLQRSQGVAAPSPWRVEARPIAVVKSRYIDFIFPGMLAMAIMQTCLGSGVVLLHAKKIGVLRRLRLTPVSSLQLFGGFISGRLLVVLLHLLALGLVAVLGFGAQVLSPWFALAATVALGCITFMALGVMLAVIAPSFEAGNLMVQLLSFPMSFLCGVFFKIESMPAYVAWLPKVLPLTYLVETMRGLITLGAPIASYRVDLGVLAGWLAAALLVAAFGLRHLQSDEG